MQYKSASERTRTKRSLWDTVGHCGRGHAAGPRVRRRGYLYRKLQRQRFIHLNILFKYLKPVSYSVLSTVVAEGQTPCTGSICCEFVAYPFYEKKPRLCQRNSTPEKKSR